MKFNIGDKAVERKSCQACSSFQVFEVIGTLDGNLLLKWWGVGYDGEIKREDFLINAKPGTRSFREGILRYTEEELYTPDEAFAEILRLETVQSKLDQDFEDVRDQVENKMIQAAKLVKEAAEIAKGFDRDFYVLKRECMPLHQALQDGGWRESHMQC